MPSCHPRSWMLQTQLHISTHDIQYLASTMIKGEAKLLSCPPNSHGEICCLLRQHRDVIRKSNGLKQWIYLPAHKEDERISCYASRLCDSDKATNQLHTIVTNLPLWVKKSALKAHKTPLQRSVICTIPS
jgi:hypothetical protein